MSPFSSHKELLNTHSFLCQQLAGLLQVLGSFVPHIGVMTQDQQALLIGKHNCKTDKNTESWLRVSARLLKFHFPKDKFSNSM